MQQQSPIVLTGLSAEDCAAFGTACSDAGSRCIHRPADLVLATPALALEGVEGVEPWVFWLYRAPWQVQAGIRTGTSSTTPLFHQHRCVSSVDLRRSEGRTRKQTMRPSESKCTCPSP